MMSEDRPDPDALLTKLHAEAAQARRGRLKVFFGASAGVGKTFAMLAAAHAAQAEGRRVTIGVVETHGRTDTEAMLRDLPRLPQKDIPYRDRVLSEFDLDAALTFGTPALDAAPPAALVLVDELAHSNVPGSRHPKRWQDVVELQSAGIDVWTTMNVQHLESLNDIVSGITGVRVRETVPDKIFDEADEVVVVDLPPDELLQRLREGKVYLGTQAQRAADSFFRKGNLLALRELALRRTADRVDDQMQAYRQQSAAPNVWPNRESLLACVGADAHAQKVVRTCARLAAQLGASWHAVHIETPAMARLPDTRRQQVLSVLKLAQELGAVAFTRAAPNAADALVRHAREHNLSRLVIGRSPQKYRWLLRQSTMDESIAAQADDLDVLQVGSPAANETIESAAMVREPFLWRGYIAATLVCAITAGLATSLLNLLELTNIVMLFLLAVVGVALRFGRGPAVLAAFLGVGLFDYLFVTPRFSFAVSDAQYVVTFFVMLVVALVVGQLTAGLKVQAEVAMQRERRVRGLYEMSRDLSGALIAEQVAEIGARFLLAEFATKCALLVADSQDQLQTLPGATAYVDIGVAQWAFDHTEAAGRGTNTLPASTCLVLPLKAPMRVRGVLAIESDDARLLSPEERQLLDTCASLLAISLERIHYIDVAQASTVQIEGERLRNSLLSAISHDLRTPLAALVGLAETLGLTHPPPSAQQMEIARAIRESALRMSASVVNLLDMARLESGAVRLNKQWQPLEETVGSAIAGCATVLTDHPVHVTFDDDLPLLHLDGVLMERVFINLLENAAKYTPSHSPIEIGGHIEGANVVVVVDDRGRGLPPLEEEAMFQKFTRGKKDRTAPGAGLGLAICRAIISAHGGTIRGETRGGGGARFTIVLPRGEPPSDDGALPDVTDRSACTGP